MNPLFEEVARYVGQTLRKYQWTEKGGGQIMRTWNRGLFTIGALALCGLLFCPTAEASTRLVFQIQPADFAEQVTVELVSPSGETQVKETSESFFFIDVPTSGTHRLTMTAGEVSDTVEVDVPYSGQLNVTFQADAPSDKITVKKGTEIENITVTARRVEETLQRVPVAITALSEQDIDNQNIVSIQKLAVATPNLWMEKNTSSSSGARAAIRGVGEDESFFTSDTPVGIYIDDIYIPRQIGAMFDLYEVDRVEVLRGPQGTLYGRNTSAGAIKIITKQPSGDFHLNLEGAVGNYSLTGFRGSVSVPVSDLFAFQVAGLYRNHEGYDTNLYNGDDVNDQDIWGVRASLRFTPGDSLDILAVGDVLVERSTPGFPLGLVPQPPFVGFYGTGLPNLDDQIDGDTDVHTLLSDLTEPQNDLDQSGLYAKVAWQAADTFTFKSITGWRDQDWQFFTDGDGQVGNPIIPGPASALPLFHIFQDQQQEQWSQEFQGVGSIGNNVEYVAGLYYFHEENQQITENVILAPLGFNRYTDTSLTTDSYAIYASFDFHLLDNLQLTAGGRWTNDDKDFDITVFNPDGGQMIACVGPDGTIISSQTPCDENAPRRVGEHAGRKATAGILGPVHAQARAVVGRDGQPARLLRRQRGIQVGRLRRPGQRRLHRAAAATDPAGGDHELRDRSQVRSVAAQVAAQRGRVPHRFRESPGDRHRSQRQLHSLLPG